MDRAENPGGSPLLRTWKREDLVSATSHQKIQDVHLELLVLAILAVRFDFRMIQRPDHVKKSKEHRTRMGEVEHRFLEHGGPHGLDIEPDAFAILPVAVGFESPDRVEGATEID